MKDLIKRIKLVSIQKLEKEIKETKEKQALLEQELKRTEESLNKAEKGNEELLEHIENLTTFAIERIERDSYE